LRRPFNVSSLNPDSLSHAGDVFQSSPPPFCPHGRTSDIDAILDVIEKAEEFIHIAVMDYVPSMLYARHQRSLSYCHIQ